LKHGFITGSTSTINKRIIKTESKRILKQAKEFDLSFKTPKNATIETKK